MDDFWKFIPGTDDMYRMSKSGVTESIKRGSWKPLKYQTNSDGYLQITLVIYDRKMRIKVHKLMAIVFLNHTPNGNTDTVDHINNIRTDNSLDNLQVIPHRENCSKDRKTTTGFTGVSYQKNCGKYRSYIKFKMVQVYFGLFKDPHEAHQVYLKAVELKDKYTGDNKHFKELVLSSTKV